MEGQATSPGRISTRDIAWGAALALSYALLWVLWNGIVVDETVLSAQILTGDVVYPAGHPHAVFHAQAWSLPNQLSALLWLLVPDVHVVSGMRNVLFLFLTLFAPFLVTLLLTGRLPFALAAGALVLADGLGRFSGVYPDFTHPTFYSHGHVGAFGLVTCVVLALAHRHRTAGFFLGLFPAIHPLLGLLAWAFALAHLAPIGGHRLHGEERKSFVAFACAGAVAALVSFLVSRAMIPEPTTSGLYAVAGDGEVVRTNFIAYTDVHRQVPDATGPLFLFGYVANAFLIFVLLRGVRSRDGGGGLALFALLVWGSVFGARFLAMLIGGLPDALVTAMPNRLSNLSTLLVVPLCVATLAYDGCTRESGSQRSSVGPLLLIGLLFLSAVIHGRGAWLGAWVGDTQRVLIGYALLGSTLGVIGRSGARVFSGLFAALFLLLHVWKAAGASIWPPAAFLVAFVAAWGLERSRLRMSLPSPALALVAVAATLAHLPRIEATTSSRMSPFDERLGDWLEEHASREEPVLTPLQPRTQLQAKTGQPVLFELGTLWLMPYLPEVSSAIGRMTAELYGVDYADADALAQLAPEGYLGQWSGVWRRKWEERSAAEWRELGRRWGFRLVLVPTEWRVDLPAVLADEAWTLRSCE